MDYFNSLDFPNGKILYLCVCARFQVEMFIYHILVAIMFGNENLFISSSSFRIDENLPPEIDLLKSTHQSRTSQYLFFLENLILFFFLQFLSLLKFEERLVV
jgi:hypothetical protein